MPHYAPPPHRRLQVFSLDPSADGSLATARISRSVLNVRWETLQPGPVGEYLAVLDVDPASDAAYEPIDLDRTLATDGLPPSTGNPQFHQQMVYAVSMETIANFERILGRHVLWAPRKGEDGEHLRIRDQFVQRLWIYPHALREQNAYYSPTKNALLFGYFNATTDDPREELPGGMVFTCLSHDIIAHETAHAILHGIYPRLLEASNDDMLAFHEAFADVVAIFQHFQVPGLLLNEIQRTRGALDQDSLLTRLAAQFARATGGGNALRNALDAFDDDGRSVAPDPSLINRTVQPHARGAILVAAIFSAFLRIYESRVADLKRIATNGTGQLPEGEIHPDLAHRFAAEAIETAERVMSICIRAIDYLPPVDVTFGDYLRALITADSDLVPDDPHRHRLAFLDAFRERGLYPLDVRALAEDTVRWSSPTERIQAALQAFLPSANVLRTMTYAYDRSKFDPEEFVQTGPMHAALHGRDFPGAERHFLDLMWQSRAEAALSDWDPASDREARFVLSKVFAVFLNRWIVAKAKVVRDDDLALVEDALGLQLTSPYPKGDDPRVEVHAVRPTLRIAADGRSRVQLLIVLMQSRALSLAEATDSPATTSIEEESLEFKFRGGCTLIIDPELGRIEYAIAKRLKSQRRLQRQVAFLREHLTAEGHDAVARFRLARPGSAMHPQLEPLASLHRPHDIEGSY